MSSFLYIPKEGCKEEDLPFFVFESEADEISTLLKEVKKRFGLFHEEGDFLVKEIKTPKTINDYNALGRRWTRIN